MTSRTARASRSWARPADCCRRLSTRPGSHGTSSTSPTRSSTSASSCAASGGSTRPPQVRHLKACRPWLSAEIAAVRPDLIVCLGAIAAKTLLGNDLRLTQDRGRLIDADVDGRPQRLIATAHPSAVLRTPAGAERDEAYAALVTDMRTAVAALTDPPG